MEMLGNVNTPDTQIDIETGLPISKVIHPEPSQPSQPSQPKPPAKTQTESNGVAVKASTPPPPLPPAPSHTDIKERIAGVRRANVAGKVNEFKRTRTSLHHTELADRQRKLNISPRSLV